MKALLRHPHRYLLAHWTVTGALAAALLLPHTAVVRAPAGGQTRTITLLTGQTVHLNADRSPRPAGGLLEGHLFGADAYAVPSNVVAITSSAYSDLPPWARVPRGVSTLSGYFSPQVFDVSYLEANGYDNAATDRIPVIVRFDNQQDAQRAVVRGLVDGIHFTHAFEYVPDAMGYVSKSGPFVSSTPDYGDDILSIYLDARAYEAPDIVTPAGMATSTAQAAVAPLMSEALPLIGGDVARKRGLTGKGIKIAVVDTGIDGTHEDLAGRVVAAKDFSSDGNTNDGFGHGTHVAGIAAGTGAASDGKYGGVAPQAQFINAKALSKNGSGSLSGIMRAMEWAADQGARIENLSLGGGPTDGKDPISQDVNAITAKKNVLFVIAAGNSGPGGKVSTPGAADSALTVGAIDKQRALAPFSSRGPRTGDMAVKPDIVAPGVRITAPRANHGNDDPYATYSGTSMATPMVAGAAALVMQLHPDWSALKVKAALMNGASPIGDDGANYVSIYDQGAGMVDLRNMVDQRMLIEPASLSFGVLKGSEQQTKEVTLQNLTAQPLTIDLAGTLHQVQGNGTASLEVQAQITLPASGSATVRITARAGSGKGLFSGDIVATQDGKVVARAVAGFTLK